MIKRSLTMFAEWTSQEKVWIGWPSDTDNWPYDLQAVRDEVAALVAAYAETVPVYLLAGNETAARSAKRMCPMACGIHVLPMGDIWLRDTGPIFAKTDDQPIGLTFKFNGWGGRYILPGDTETASAILSTMQMSQQRHDYVLEGGAIEHNGAGTVLTTEQCLLNPNRNSDWNKSEATTALKNTFGASRIVWLEEGLAGDHTDGHIDNLARFIGLNRVVCQSASGIDDPNADIYEAIFHKLIEEGFETVRIPSPGRVLDPEGDIAAASHMNFVFANGRIIMPVYNQYGEDARLALAEALPDYDVVALPSGQILTGGGSFHCISQQVPKLCVTREGQG